MRFAATSVTSSPPDDPFSQPVQPEETLVRFAHDERHHGVQDGAAFVKGQLFAPNRLGQVSVWRIDGLEEAEIWAIWDRNCPPVFKDKPVRGRAQLLARVVVDHPPLRLDATNDPPGHVDIVGWPMGDENKRHQLSLRNDLAAASDFIPVP